MIHFLAQQRVLFDFILSCTLLYLNVHLGPFQQAQRGVSGAVWT